MPAMIAEPRPTRKIAPDGERLSKRVMALKGCSRRDAESFIEGGWVSVDGQVVEEPMFRVSTQRVEIDTKASLLELASVTLLLNKPPGFDAMAAPGVHGTGQRGVQSAQKLLQAATHHAAEPHYVKDAQRVLKRHFNQLTPCVPLETAASGLVVFTQDWRVARKLVEDAAVIEQELMVEVAGAVSPEALQKLNHSGKKEDSALPPVKASVSSTADTSTRLRFAVKGAHPGLIAWLCERAGLEIQSMKRIRIGRVGLGQVPVGQWRYLLAHERF